MTGPDDDGEKRAALVLAQVEAGEQARLFGTLRRHAMLATTVDECTRLTIEANQGLIGWARTQPIPLDMALYLVATEIGSVAASVDRSWYLTVEATLGKAAADAIEGRAWTYAMTAQAVLGETRRPTQP